MPSFGSFPFWGTSQSEAAEENGAGILLFRNVFGGMGREGEGGVYKRPSCARDPLDHLQELEQASKGISETTFESLIKFHSQEKKCVYLQPRFCSLRPRAPDPLSLIHLGLSSGSVDPRLNCLVWSIPLFIDGNFDPQRSQRFPKVTEPIGGHSWSRIGL